MFTTKFNASDNKLKNGLCKIVNKSRLHCTLYSGTVERVVILFTEALLFIMLLLNSKACVPFYFRNLADECFMNILCDYIKDSTPLREELRTSSEGN